MKTALGSFEAMLASGVTTIARCWRVVRKDGTVFGFTDHDRKLSFDGTDYEPATGFTRSSTETDLGLAVGTMEIEGALSSDVITEEDIALGLWDQGAYVYSGVDWTDPANRAVLKAGTFGEVTRGTLGLQMEMRGLAAPLNQDSGRTYGPLCDAIVGDARCKFLLSTTGYHGSGAIISSTDDILLGVSDLDAFAEGWFVAGLLTWVTGANTGGEIEVRGHSVAGVSVTLTLFEKSPLPIEAGDTFTITAGCDKTFATCKAKFANGDNFRGFPLMVTDDVALAFAKSNQTNDGGSFFN